MKRTLAFALILVLLAFPAKAKDWCETVYPADPAALAASLLPSLERLNSSIPSLSPREEQWIKEEMAASGQRQLRAISSREYALQQAKYDANSLLGLIRRLTGKHDQADRERSWLWFAYSLLQTDSAFYLAKLVADRVIQREAIPQKWRLLEGAQFTLARSISSERRILAQHILICTLPTVMDLSMTF